MTAIAKTALTADVSLLVQGEAADATDIIPPITDLLNHAKSGRVAVSTADTHVKHLEDGLTATVGGGITITKQNASANENLALAVDPAVVVKLTAAQSVSNKTIPSGAGNSVAPGALSQGGAVNGEVLIWNGSAWVPGANGGGGALPVDITVTAGETLAERDFVYLTSSNTWKKVDIDVSPVAMGRWRGIVNQAGGIANAATGTVRLMGEVSGFTALTAGSMVYASTTAGSFTQTRPTPTLAGSQVAVVPIGLATSTTKILLMGPARMQYLRRASLANNATLLMEHHSDPLGQGRLPRAYVNSVDLGSIQTYSTSNADFAVAIKGPFGAGCSIPVDTAGVATITLGDNAGSDRRNAQQFEVTAVGTLSTVAFNLSASNGTPTGDITVTLQSDAADFPSGVVLASTTVTPVASSVNTATFTNSPVLFLSTKYWITWEVPIQGTNNRYTMLASASSVYANGLAKADTTAGASFPGTWATTIAADYRCTITVAALVTTDRLAQGWIHSTTADVGSAKFYLRKVGTPTGNLAVEIRSDSSGAPGTLLATSATLDVTTLTGSYVLYELAFASLLSIGGSVQYHALLTSTSTASTSNYVEVAADTSSASYANGVAQKEISSSWSAVGGDFVFDILAVVTSYNEPCVIGRASGGTRDVSVRYDSGSSGVNVATNTLGKNVSGGTLDITLVVEMD